MVVGPLKNFLVPATYYSYAVCFKVLALNQVDLAYAFQAKGTLPNSSFVSCVNNSNPTLSTTVSGANPMRTYPLNPSPKQVTTCQGLYFDPSASLRSCCQAQKNAIWLTNRHDGVVAGTSTSMKNLSASSGNSSNGDAC